MFVIKQCFLFAVQEWRSYLELHQPIAAYDRRYSRKWFSSVIVDITEDKVKVCPTVVMFETPCVDNDIDTTGALQWLFQPV